MPPLLSVRNLSVYFKVATAKKWAWSSFATLKAVNSVSFDLEEGRTVGIVGESGCGKSTLVRSIVGLEALSDGEVYFEGRKIDYSNINHKHDPFARMQMIFQDPMSSLNPRMTVGETVTEPLRSLFPHLSADETKQKTYDMLERVGIAKSHVNRYSHEFSGGQCQRIGIARALICQPKLLICDEPVSALDVSVQAQIINLLKRLQKEMGLSLIFVAHDLAVVRHISDNIAVLYAGTMMEYGKSDDVIQSPQHPYTKALLSAVPVPNPKIKILPQILTGELPSPLHLPQGCPFEKLCPIASDHCKKVKPDLEGYSHKVACHNYTSTNLVK